ncbi:Beta-ketoacyl-[acyl-carrier-protein] synthase family protein [Sulfidibacter corallicola]|uniref:Beta-ketoacyl-[acyl-carrier-protein] synthase family protein n=1 Tax=Sulfidibacter corallicola TaxID=2818388 RepID=A0A8A4TR29_SULCO|nr:beta-ketoacyl-[acyl-carrier-protein] synthase family protein [Sulfidibacter corallicola]QTD52000.1 beta-ketoacyl-[acyl-carrier-protein] synthase family protein [Sulfidibacter corallicola]
MSPAHSPQDKQDPTSLDDGRLPAIAATAMVLPGGFRWKDLREGRSAVRFLGDTFPVAVGAPVTESLRVPEHFPYDIMPRGLLLAVEALRRLEYDSERRFGLVLGLPSLFSETEYVEHMLVHRHDEAEMGPMMGFAFGNPLDYLAGFAGARGPVLRVDSACATGNDALIAACRLLEAGTVRDVLVVCASSMLNPVGLALFHNLKALNDRSDLEASCPFDARRRGFVMGEGAAALWLTVDPPRSQVEGFVCGYGSSMSGVHFVDLPEDLTPVERACRAALRCGEVPSYVSAHGTATQANDAMETRLHRSLFGERAESIPLSSIKSMIGHCLGAAALIEAIVCLHALNEQIAPPTINLHRPDPRCDLDYVPLRARPIRGRYALSNAFAFGGHNASVLLRGAAL